MWVPGMGQGVDILLCLSPPVVHDVAGVVQVLHSVVYIGERPQLLATSKAALGVTCRQFERSSIIYD